MAVVVALLVKLLGRRRPHLAYILWMVVLVKGLTPPLWSSPTSVFSWTAREANVRVVEPLAASAKPVAVQQAAQIEAQFTAADPLRRSMRQQAKHFASRVNSSKRLPLRVTILPGLLPFPPGRSS